ncbi:13395_t:CDS:2 [Gigaspora margarita]|uniref:13395_t:CDS:1 n=1 Tax=Gigaspora margarita TaxID=4874 RepID=A0ABN7V8W3_GIGMA|nr:13395_t:CDS:2 [Gigaspora margarita]
MSLVDDNLLKTESRDSYFVLSPIQFEKLKQISEAVFKLANETLLEIVNQNEVESWIESRYGVVKSLWKNELKVEELNTGSGSGWVRSSLTKKVASADKIGIPLAPPPTFYANYVLYKLGPKIAIIITEAVPECDFVARQIECLGGEAKVIYLSEVIDKYTTGAIPKTYVLLTNDLTKNLNFMEQNKAVLKAEIMNSNKEWIIQELCYLQNTKDNRYEDISVFVVDGVVQGFMSRISANEIVNVEQGGFFQSVVLKYDN